VRLIESGPAGGGIFASQVRRARRRKKVLSFDMGGTLRNLPDVGVRVAGRRAFLKRSVCRMRTCTSGSTWWEDGRRRRLEILDQADLAVVRHVERQNLFLRRARRHWLAKIAPARRPDSINRTGKRRAVSIE